MSEVVKLNSLGEATIGLHQPQTRILRCDYFFSSRLLFEEDISVSYHEVQDSSLFPDNHDIVVSMSNQAEIRRDG